MSEKALITRAWKITNIGKLKSYVEVSVGWARTARLAAVQENTCCAGMGSNS